MKSSGDKFAFFRQSGWMVIATLAGGVFMSAVHVVVIKPMRPPEYSVFYTLLRVFLLMGFAAGGLQVVFAQQAAAAISGSAERKLSETTRAVLRATFLIWLLMSAVVFVFRRPIIASLEISNPAALWITLLLGLASLWAPVIKGILQGRQNFAGLGWVLILDGIGRFSAIVLIVQLGGQAAGGMTGALIGQMVSLMLGVWLVRRIMVGAGEAFDWKPWLHRVIPLTFGVGAVLFMTSADVVYVQWVFAKDEAPFYIPAAMIGLALITFTTPMAAVMFPKIVDSAARSEKTDALRHALATTTILGGVAALACTFLPELPLRILYFRNPLYWKSATLIPWFAWSLLPLIVANILVNNLLARERFRIVPWLVAIALGYAAVLGALRERLVLFWSGDVRDPAALAAQIQQHSRPITHLLWDQLSSEQRQQLTSTPPQGAAAASAVLVPALNALVKGEPLYLPARFPGIALCEEAQLLIPSNPQGKERVRLNRLLLQEAFASELASPREKLFGGFKMVIGTLGIFSALLLLVAMWFTFAKVIPRPLASLGPRRPHKD